MSTQRGRDRTASTTAVRPPLSRRLRDETAALHLRAERSAVIGALVDGSLGRAGYARLLRDLHAIYAALEPALARWSAHPIVAALWTPALARTAALERDLEVVAGADWRVAIAASETAHRYSRRLRWLARSRPVRVAAHAYVRYFGDLSGGAILGGAVTRALELTQDAHGGASFYDFSSLGTNGAARFKAAARAALDAAVRDPAEADALVAEARRGFALHVRLFERLGGALDLGTGSASGAARAALTAGAGDQGSRGVVGRGTIDRGRL